MFFLGNYRQKTVGIEDIINLTRYTIVMKIVVTSGGFDPVHVGHIRCFKEAKKHGDRLVVILNTDEFLLRKKGFVFMPFHERKELLESFGCVDEVIPCIDEDQTVCKTLEMLKPHVFVKGGDRTIGNIPEREICERHNIAMVFDVGGGKVQSSSWLTGRLKDHFENQVIDRLHQEGHLPKHLQLKKEIAPSLIVPKMEKKTEKKVKITLKKKTAKKAVVQKKGKKK